MGLSVAQLCLSVALFTFPVNGALSQLRVGSWLPLDKMKHLLLDIQESVKKAGEDADLTYATLDTYGQQLDVSLLGEISALNQSLTKLEGARSKYNTQIHQSQHAVHDLDATVRGSDQIANSYRSGTEKIAKKFDGLLASVGSLVALLEQAVITPDGTLVTPEEPDAHGQPTHVYNAIRRLLLAHSGLAKKYKAVFTTFNPASLLQRSRNAASQAVHMTAPLLENTIGALKEVEGSLRNQRSKALGEFETRKEKYQSNALEAKESELAQTGVQAENEEKADDLSFSIHFAQAVMNKDTEFRARVEDAVHKKRAIVASIHKLSSQQLVTLKNLNDIMDGKYSVPVQGHEAARAPVSFLEVRHEDLRVDSGLETEIERTLRNKGDTHALLLKIKSGLDQQSTEQIDADNVKDVMSQLEAVLRAATGEQSKADEVKRRCDSRSYRANAENQGLKANVALMRTAREHTLKTVKAATSNLKGVSQKVAALKKSESDFTQIDATAMNTLEGQAKDRQSIMTALMKAAKIAQGTLPADKAPAVTLMRQLLEEFKEQEALDKSYRAKQRVFKTAFLQYVEDYVQLLGDRRNHYQDTLAALHLYAEELGSDETSQMDALTDSEELQRENADLCQGIMQFYERHEKQRRELISTLRVVLPKVPDILNTDADGSGGRLVTVTAP